MNADLDPQSYCSPTVYSVYPINGDVLVRPGFDPGPGPGGELEGGNVLESVHRERGPPAQHKQLVLVVADLMAVPTHK